MHTQHCSCVARVSLQVGADAVAHGATGKGNDQVRLCLRACVYVCVRLRACVRPLLCACGHAHYFGWLGGLWALWGQNKLHTEPHTHIHKGRVQRGKERTPACRCILHEKHTHTHTHTHTQVRFEVGYYSLKPDIKVIAPW